MNWLEFFFGWLIKGQYEVSMLDAIMFWIEFILVCGIGIFIYCLIPEKKDSDD